MSKIHSGLVSFATMICASAVFAEPPLQPGDTLESLSQVKVETTINGQPGSLEQMGIPKQVIAQAIEQNAVIDIENRTLIAASSVSHAGTDESLAHTQPSSTDIQAQAENPVVVSDDPNVLAQIEQQQSVDQSQHLAAQNAGSDSSIGAETDSTALAQGESQQLTDQSQQLAVQNAGSDSSIGAETDSTALAQGESQQLTDQSQQLTAQNAGSDSSIGAETDSTALAQGESQQLTDQSQQLAVQNAGSDSSIGAETDSTALAQGEQQQLTDQSQQLAAQTTHADSSIVAEADPNMVAIQPNQQIDQDTAAAMPEQNLEQIDPTAQAIPAQSEQMDETPQYGDTESGMPTPLQ